VGPLATIKYLCDRGLLIQEIFDGRGLALLGLQFCSGVLRKRT